MVMKNIGSSKTRLPKSTSVATAGVAIAERSSRACDVCELQRVHWYCAADEAYLCDRCDIGVHNANTVALRHERVRLAPNGTPLKMPKRSTSHKLSKPSKRRAKEAGAVADRTKRQTSSPAVVLQSGKRCRSSRPHPHHFRGATDHQAPRSHKIREGSEDEDVHDRKVKVELVDPCELSDEVVDNGRAQEVPAFITVIQDSNESEIFLPGYIRSNGSYLHEAHSASSESFAGFFKGKAAQVLSQCNLRLNERDEFLVPDSFHDCLDSGVDISVNFDDAGFIGGDIPGLVIDGFDGFDVEYRLNFDLALQSRSEDAFERDHGADGDAGSEYQSCFTSTTSSDGCGSSLSSGVKQQHSWDLELLQRIPASPNPFAHFFVSSRVQAESNDASKQLQGPEKMKKEAEEILKCSLEGLSEEDLRHVPSLRLNYEDVLNAWSDRGALWTDNTKLSQQTVSGVESFNSDAPDSCTDTYPIPDMTSQEQQDGARRGADDCLTNNDSAREARVLRYKEKRRTRLFSKKIRYEVRKLNAERRPRMKGRFMKRTQVS